MADLFDLPRLQERIEQALESKQILFQQLYTKPAPTASEIIPTLQQAAERLAPFV